MSTSSTRMLRSAGSMRGGLPRIPRTSSYTFPASASHASHTHTHTHARSIPTSPTIPVGAYGSTNTSTNTNTSTHTPDLTPEQTQKIIDSNQRLLDLLPECVKIPSTFEKLVDVTIDVGKVPVAWFVDGTREVLGDTPVEVDDVIKAARKLTFDAVTNRAIIEGSLHRVSAMRDQRGAFIGLTIRPGVENALCDQGRSILHDILQIELSTAPSESLLIVGPPAAGKTTMLREAARLLATKYRVIVIDPSGEIGGDGSVSHTCLGNSRRMSVPYSKTQADVMLEAVRNHAPHVIIVDELGGAEDAWACRTIAERGVRIVATVHGTDLASILKNPAMSDIVGGVETATLGDDRAARSNQNRKVSLERRGPATFNRMIEIRRDSFSVHRQVEKAVDTILNRGL